jgi:hypothetical protein
MHPALKVLSITALAALSWLVFWIIWILAIIGVSALSEAFAHSWYDKGCCDIRDCQPMTEDYLPVENGMYILPNGERVSVDNARPSLDGKFHWCRFLGFEGASGSLIRPSGQPNCLYVPNNGV